MSALWARDNRNWVKLVALVEGFEGFKGVEGVAGVKGVKGLGSKRAKACQSVHFNAMSITKRARHP